MPEIDVDALAEGMLRDFFGENFLSSARVFCLTSDPTNDAMWANYAGGHAGCVFGFRNIPELSTPFIEARPVKYSSETPVAGSGIDFFLYGGDDALRRATVDAVCFTKKLEWSYEKEWRVMAWRPRESDQFADYECWPDELESVTLGSKISTDDEAEIVKLVRSTYPRCSLYRLKVDRGETRRLLIE